MLLQAGDRFNCVSRFDRQTCSKYRWPFEKQSFNFTCDKDCQTLPVTVWEDRKKTKIKLTYKNSPHYNGTPHQKCHYLRLLRSRTHWCDKGVSRIFKVVYSHCCCASQLSRNVSLWQLTQPCAHRLYLGSWMSQRNCADISSLRVQPQSHLKLQDAHSPCAAFYRRLAEICREHGVDGSSVLQVCSNSSAERN